MKLTVENVGGCKSAELELEPGKVKVLGGLNEAGKTSVARALQALVTRNANPLGLLKSERSKYVRSGAETSTATLVGDEWSLKWDIEEGQVEEGGEGAPRDLPDIYDPRMVYLDKKQASERWQAYLGVVVEWQMLVDRLKDAVKMIADGGDVLVDRVTNALQDPDRQDVCLTDSNAWDQMFKVAEEQYQGQKKEWSRIVATTGVNKDWGVRIAGKWRPQGWKADCEGVETTTAQKRVDEAQAAVNALESKSGAVVYDPERLAALEDKRRSLLDDWKVANEGSIKEAQEYVAQKEHYRDWEQKAAAVDATRSAIRQSERAIDKLGKDLAQAEADLKEAPQPMEGGIECPHCGGLVLYNMGRLDTVPADTRTPLVKKVGDLKEAIAALEVSLGNERDRLKGQPMPDGPQPTEPVHPSDKQNSETSRKKTIEAEGSVLKGQIDAMKAAKDTKRSDDRELEIAKERLEDAKKDRDMIKAYNEALAAHQLVLAWTGIAKVVKADGLRAVVAAERVGLLNRYLSKMSEGGAAWSKVTVDPKTWLVYVDGRNIRLCSDSERWRASAAVSIALAHVTKASVLILDNCERLVGVERNSDTLVALWRFLQHSANEDGRAVLLVTAKSEVPNMPIMHKGQLAEHSAA